MKRLSKAILSTLAVGIVVAAATWLTSLFVRFGQPQRLYLAVIPVILYGCWVGYGVWRARAVDTLGDTSTLQSLVVGTSRVRDTIAAFLVVASALLAVFAFAIPQWGEETREVERRGIDVVLAVDISRSMLAEDVPPNRLQGALSEVEDMLDTMRGDRVGLVVYAGVAFTQSPLTSDYGAIRLYLDRLHPDALPIQGTAIGRAIEEGRDLLTGGENENFKRAQHQIMVVISDGEDHETNPVAAAEKAAEQGIRVFTVGVGSSEGARIPLRDENGNLREYLTDRSDQVVISKLEDDQLGEIARAGNGDYIRYTGEGSVSDQLQQAIDSFDEEALSSVLRAEYVDRPLFFLIPSALLLLFSFILRGFPGRRSSVGLTVSLVLLLGGCKGIERDDPAVEAAVEASQNDQHEQAVSSIEQADEEAREQAGYWFDRGLIHARAGQPDEAIDAYLRALGLADSKLRDDSLVGIGNALFEQTNYREARNRYERALQLNTNYEAARRNLEIALRREFPPCRTLDDEYEDNDQTDSATTIPETSLIGNFPPRGMQMPSQGQQGAMPPAPGQSRGQGDGDEEAPQMIVCGGDNDYYRIPVHGGDELSVEATFRRLREDNGGPPLPERIEPADVRISLMDATGENILAVDQGMDDGADKVSAGRVIRSIEDVEIPRSLGADGGVLLLVETDEPLEYEYDLEVSVIPPCRVLEDSFEENDSRLGAAPVESGEQRAMSCQNDPDWYAVNVEAGDDVFVDVKPGVSAKEEPVMLQTSLATDTTAREFDEAQTSEQELAAVEARNIQEDGQLTFKVEAVGEQEGQYPFEVFRFPPCPEGNDRFEPNNSQQQAAGITPDKVPIRHLRLCGDDQDWFRLTLPPSEDEQNSTSEQSTDASDDEEPEPEAFSAVANYEGADRNVIVELYSAETGKQIASSEDMQTQPAGGDETDEGDGPSQGQTAVATMLDPETREIVVRVQGDPGYYHLSFPETEARQQQQQKQSGDGEQDKDSQENADQEQQQDGEQQEQSAEQQDSSQDDPTEQQQPQPGQEEGESEQARSPGEPTDEQAEREALMQLLDSLEDEDVNLQLRQALDDIPPTQMRNEW